MLFTPSAFSIPCTKASLALSSLYAPSIGAEWHVLTFVCDEVVLDAVNHTGRLTQYRTCHRALFSPATVLGMLRSLIRTMALTSVCTTSFFRISYATQ